MNLTVASVSLHLFTGVRQHDLVSFPDPPPRAQPVGNGLNVGGIIGASLSEPHSIVSTDEISVRMYIRWSAFGVSRYSNYSNWLR